MPIVVKKVRRRRSVDELVVEQAQDAATVDAMLEQSGIVAHGSQFGAGCFLMAYFGEAPAGIAWLETNVDAG